MDCPNCGYVNSESGSRCIRCGTKLKVENTSAVGIKSKEGDYNSKSTRGEGVYDKTTYDLYHGVVINYGLEEEKYGKLYKWFRALFRGIPYVKSNQKHHLQLMTEEVHAKPTCIDILIWGRIKYGYINNGNYLQIYGHKCPNGSVVAKKIVNVTSVQRGGAGIDVILEKGIAPMVIRVLTAIFVVLIISVGINIGQADFDLTLGNIKNILIVLLLIYIGFIWIKRKIRRKLIGW